MGQLMPSVPISPRHLAGIFTSCAPTVGHVTLGTLSIENVEKWKRKGRARCGVGRVGLGKLVSSAVRYRDHETS